MIVCEEEEAEDLDRHFERSVVVPTGVRSKEYIWHPMLFANVIERRLILEEVTWKTVVRRL